MGFTFHRLEHSKDSVVLAEGNEQVLDGGNRSAAVSGSDATYVRENMPGCTGVNTRGTSANSNTRNLLADGPGEQRRREFPKPERKAEGKTHSNIAVR